MNRNIQHPSAGSGRLLLTLLLLAALPLAAACAVDTEREGDEVEMEAEVDTAEAERGLEETGRELGEGMREAGEAIEEGAREAGRELEPHLDDARITAAVKSRLTAHPDINPFEIDVDTVDGVVTLTGEVESEEDREDALEVARETQGVREVVDNLQVEGAID